MADIEIIFNTDNAAFVDELGYLDIQEVERVLAVATSLIGVAQWGGEHPLADINGNTIGFVRITD